MRIYIAASFVAQHRLRPIRDRLLSLGHDVVSSWLDEAAKPEHLTQARFDKHLAIKDLTEVVQCDCVILDMLEPSTTGGRYVELGIALANSKLVYQVGPQVGIFERLVDEAFATWEHAINCLEAEHTTTKYVPTGMGGKAYTQDATDSTYTKWGIWCIPVNDVSGPPDWYQSSGWPQGAMIFDSRTAAHKFIKESEHIQTCIAKYNTTYDVRGYS